MSTDTRPRLRRNLRFHRHENEGVISWVVKDPTALKYFRFGQIEAWLMQQMDGTRSLQDICDLLREEVGLRTSPAALDVLTRRLKELGLVERSLKERSTLLMERLRSERKLWKNGKNTLLRMRFSFGDPDQLLARMVKAMPFFWTPGFVIASVIAFAIYGVILWLNWQPFADTMAIFYSPSRMTLELFVLCYGCFTATAIVHEFGHGLTCKRFGGEVHEIGAMLLYFTPAFYCNVSDAWALEKRSERMWVTFAGGWIQLWCAALATVLWRVTEPGTLVNTAALYTAALGGAFSLLFNYNPLIPLDGYYALTDWLQIANLRSRALEYVGARIRRDVLRLDAALPAVTDRERRIFITYGIAASVYTTFMLSVLALFVARLLVPRFGLWGAFIFVALLFAVTGKARHGVVSLVRTLVTEKLPPGRRARFALICAAAVLLLGGAAFFTPWTVRATGSATVEPELRRWLRPPESARLMEVRVAEGAAVQGGDTIAVLREPELELHRIAAVTKLEQLRGRMARARATGDAATERAASIELETTRSQLTTLEDRRNALILRAPFSGVFVTSRLEERLGERIAAGDSLIEVWSLGSLRARVRVPQRVAGEITHGAEIRIRFSARPGLTWKTQVDRLESAADGSDLIALAALPQSDAHPVLPGMSGRARVDITHVTIARALERAARRIVRLDFLL
jgi:putative peptide zinc metalloprotease protein